MTRPLISVVMCTFNGEAYLSSQLDSICGQTYDNLEIIVCDDASSDGTWTLLQRFANLDRRIRLFRNDVNIGFRKNFEKAASHCSAAYVAFSDQDDIWHSQKLERLMNHWTAECPLVYCDSQRFADEKSITSLKPKKNYRRFEGNKLRRLCVFNTISGHAMIVRRELLTQVFPVGEGVFYDWKAGMIAAINGGVCYLAETLVFQRVHENNITMGSGFDWNDAAGRPAFRRLLVLHLKEFAGLPGMTNDDQRFMQRLEQLLHSAQDKSFSFPLFRFLFTFRQDIFWHKKKSSLALFSQLKYCYRLAHS